MSSLTVDEIKRILAENGVEIPAGRLKKEDYVKLYEENMLSNLTNSSGFSDSENTENSRKVTSTNEVNSQLVEETVRSLTNDELFAKLKDIGYNPGPVLPNTRRVYENKLLKLIQIDGVSNGGNNGVRSDDVSDEDVPGPSRRSVTPARDVTLRSVTPQIVTSPEPVAPRRYTYIEKIPRGTSERIIEPVTPEFDIRRRPAATDVTDNYRGSWSPSATINKIGTQNTQASTEANNNRLAILAVAGLLLAGLAVYIYSVWSSLDPYKALEDGAKVVSGGKK